ncbi:TPA: amidohydrolase family protein [Burkholderia cenocepacia]|nr:amidohydrolase family protein [Burkholderia cenocepacia]
MIDLDVHAHLAPIKESVLGKLARVAWDAEKEILTLDGHQVGMKNLFHADRLIARMDHHDVKRALVSIPPPLYRQDLTSQDALVWARYVNEGMLEITRASRGRLGALLYVPLEHPSLLRELLKDFEDVLFEGVALAAGGHPAIIYSSEQYAELWSWLDQRSMFVFLHPGNCCDTRLTNYYLHNLVGNPIETGVAAAHLVMAGVPERYSRIRFCLAHAGGIFTSLIGRMERGFDTTRPGVDMTIERPFAAAKRLFVDNIAHDDGVLDLCEKIYGKDHILYGSDWPFPMGLRED